MSYPSIPSIPGSANRTTPQLTEALRPLLSSLTSRHSPTSSTSRPRVLEIASGTGEHVACFARTFDEVDWVGTDREEITIQEELDHLKFEKLDVLDEESWGHLRRTIESEEIESDPNGLFSGIIINNLLHCSPFPSTIQSIFRQLGSPGNLVRKGGFVSIYGAFLGDDGEFGSEGDRQFDERFRGLDGSFGLRKVPDVCSAVEARELGPYEDSRDTKHEDGSEWVLEERKWMERGNWMLVFRRR